MFGRVPKRVRYVRAEADRVPLVEDRTPLSTQQELNLADDDERKLLTSVSDRVVAVAGAGLERDQVGLDLVVVPLPEEAVEDALPAPPAATLVIQARMTSGVTRLTVAIGFVTGGGEEVCDVQAKVVGDLL